MIEPVDLPAPTPEAARRLAAALVAADRASDALQAVAGDPDDAKVVAAAVLQVHCLRFYHQAQDRVGLEMNGWTKESDR